MIYLLLAVLLLAAYLFLRHLKGRRTVIFGALTTGFGAVVPLPPDAAPAPPPAPAAGLLAALLRFIRFMLGGKP